ncbi:hypothetical protein [Persicobacter psychrovividus]|uniref:Outer membrane protein beta-barrel domain-containing protein n=1 Tax=Persicobacter psychrovividus TaxID=387638 RepID=A0ABN6LAJ2_9BACT|nr:hypothetical protein PEPS_09430 [Persicobacter psychrovividus]
MGEIIVFTFLLLTHQANAQIGVSSYGINAVSVNTPTNKMISGELKTFANRDFEDLLFELDGFYNFKAGTYHRFSAGLGIAFSPFISNDRMYAVTVPLSLELYPLQDLKQISLLFEVAPEFLIDNPTRLRTLWGIRYTFGSTSKSSSK